MRKRIYGLETEYGIAFMRKNGSWTCDDSVLNPLLEYLHNFSGSQQFLPNGSRLYIDMRTHPEYCTAECLDLADLIAQDKAGEKILDRIFDQQTEQNQGRVHLFKNNVQYVESDEDAAGPPVTFGCHENFSMASWLNERELASVFIPFLVARQVISGSGWVANYDFQNKGIKYAISQRARFIGSVTSNYTTEGWQRAIFSTSRWGEPFADKEKYRRLHLIVGDSNMSELSTYLKMATVGILLDILEEGYPLWDRVARLMPRDQVRALHLISRDLTCKEPVIELRDGKFISALNMLQAYFEIMEEYERACGMKDDLSSALKIMKDILWRLEKREIDKETLMEINSQGLDEELDWLIKKSMLEYGLQKFGCSWKDFYGKKIQSAEGEINVYGYLRYRDLKYHDISDSGLYNDYVSLPDLSPSELKASQVRTPRVVEKEKIKDMEKNPPQNTRAKIRGDFIKFLKERGTVIRHFAFDWDKISVTGSPFFTELRRLFDENEIHLPDPFAVENEQVNSLKSIIESVSLY